MMVPKSTCVYCKIRENRQKGKKTCSERQTSFKRIEREKWRAEHGKLIV